MSEREKGGVPDVLLERYRLGELSAAQRDLLERRLATDAEARGRLARLEASDREIEGRHPPEWLAGRVRARLQSRASLRGGARAARTLSWAAALASAAAVVVVVSHLRPLRPVGEPAAVSDAPPATRPAPDAPHAAEGGDRVKGLQPSLVLYRKTAAGSEPLEDGARARAGDVVRLAYRAAGRGYGAVLSIDGRGVVTRHLPATGSRAVPLRPGATVLLDQAYELDDAERFERFYLVVSDRPFDLEPVLRAARRAAASSSLDPAGLRLPAGFEHSTFSLVKEESR
jgi:hypothetical protein